MDLRHLSMRHLRCISEVGRTKSAALAAGRLGITPSAVSKTLREVEKIAGVRLFVGTRRGTTATKDGELLIDRVNIALTTIRNSFEQLHGARRGEQESLRIGALPVFAASILPDILLDLTFRHPMLRIEIATGVKSEMLARLRRGEIAILFGRLPPPEELNDLIFEQLLLDEYIFVVRKDHPLSRPGALASGILDPQWQIILPSRETVTWDEIVRLYTANGASLPDRRIETTDLLLSRSLVLQSDAVWIASRRAITDDLDAKRLIPLDLETSMLKAPLGAITARNGEKNDAAQALLERCRELL